MNDKEKLKHSVRLHRSASELSGKALAARIYGDRESYLRLTREAFVKEARSAELLRHNPSHHMHAILHRSAATLAIRCGEYRAAESLIAHGLAGDPDQGLREQLTELRDEVRQQLAQSKGDTSADLNEIATKFVPVAVDQVPVVK